MHNKQNSQLFGKKLFFQSPFQLPTLFCLCLVVYYTNRGELALLPNHTLTSNIVRKKTRKKWGEGGRGGRGGYRYIGYLLVSTMPQFVSEGVRYI